MVVISLLKDSECATGHQGRGSERMSTPAMPAAGQKIVPLPIDQSASEKTVVVELVDCVNMLRSIAAGDGFRADLGRMRTTESVGSRSRE